MTMVRFQRAPGLRATTLACLMAGGWTASTICDCSHSKLSAQDRGQPSSTAELDSTPNTDLVGRWRDDVTVTPVNQLLTPFGKQVDLTGMRPQALALSADGRTMVVAGKTNDLVVMDPVSGEIRER